MSRSPLDIGTVRLKRASVWSRVAALPLALAALALLALIPCRNSGRAGDD